jgi:hypothetical protein
MRIVFISILNGIGALVVGSVALPPVFAIIAAAYIKHVKIVLSIK